MLFFLGMMLVLILTGCDAGYTNDGKKISYTHWSAAHGRTKVVLESADPFTFKVINFKYDIAVDKNHVYWAGNIIKGADPGTYSIIKYSWATDKNNVYSEFMVPIEHVDLNSFVPVTSSWAKDKNDWYWGDAKLNVCDYETFNIIYSDNISSLAKDRYCVYLEFKKIAVADPLSIHILANESKGIPPYFFADKYNVYKFSTGEIVKGLDPETFHYSTETAADKNHCYNFDMKQGCRPYSEILN